MKMKISLQEQPTFRCSACGKCCSHIRGFIPEQDKNFVKEYAYGKLPVVQLIPIEQMTFPLWDWEAKRFMKWAEEKKIDASIKPLRAILDGKNKKAIILTYFIDSKGDACPFLKENKCAIYDTKRAYVCRLFPFNRGPYLKEKGMTLSKEQLFGYCGGMEPLLPQIPQEFDKLIPFLKEAFPNGEFLNAVQNDLIVEWSNKVIIDLLRKRMVLPLMNKPYEQLYEHYSAFEKIDFTDFLVGSGYYSTKEMGVLLTNFDQNKGAKEKISS